MSKEHSISATCKVGENHHILVKNTILVQLAKEVLKVTAKMSCIMAF